MVLWQLKEKRGISHTGTNEAARRCCSTPAHGYGGGLPIKEALLKLEGALQPAPQLSLF